VALDPTRRTANIRLSFERHLAPAGTISVDSIDRLVIEIDMPGLVFIESWQQAWNILLLTLRKSSAQYQYCSVPIIGSPRR